MPLARIMNEMQQGIDLINSSEPLDSLLAKGWVRTLGAMKDFGF